MKDNSKVLITVVVPVFNTEKYISRCIESIINQSYTNLEILIINDGSSDSSLSIINEYCKNDNRCKLINLQQNIGVGNARNIGIQQANGVYITFVDSDDWIDSNYLMDLYLSIERQKGIDIAIAGIKTDYANSISSSIRYQYKYKNVITNKFALKLLTNTYSQDTFISPIVNNKIYRTSFLKKIEIKFDKSKKAQDNYFSFIIFTYNCYIALVPDTYYHYYQRDDSATHTFSKEYIDNWADILISIKNELIQRKEYSQYKLEYIAFSERCLTSILKLLFDGIYDTKLQKHYLKHIFSRYQEFVDINTLIDYLDSERIRRIFNI